MPHFNGFFSRNSESAEYRRTQSVPTANRAIFFFCQQDVRGTTEFILMEFMSYLESI